MNDKAHVNMMFVLVVGKDSESPQENQTRKCCMVHPLTVNEVQKMS